MRTITLEELLEAGCHFGHQVTRQNPKAREFIFEERDKIHIIDLEQTKEGLEEAAKFVKNLAQKDGTLLVVGTKRQAETILKEEIKRVQDQGVDGISFILKRWIGGTLTNFQEVAKNFKKLKDLKHNLQDESAQVGYTKKEIGEWEKERVKLESFYGGIIGMTKIPEALFIIDTHIEDVAVKEARRMGLPTVGITDTNSDPTIIDYPIPANDDAVGSLRLIIGYIFDAWVEGRKGIKDKEEVATKEEKVAGETKEKIEAKAKEEVAKEEKVEDKTQKEIKNKKEKSKDLDKK